MVGWCTSPPPPFLLLKVGIVNAILLFNVDKTQQQKKEDENLEAACQAISRTGKKCKQKIPTIRFGRRRVSELQITPTLTHWRQENKRLHYIQ